MLGTRTVEDFVRLLGLLALLYLKEPPMDEIRLHYVLGDVLHERHIAIVSYMQNSGNTNHILSMHLDSNVRGMVGLVVTRFIAGPKLVCVDLLLGDVAFYLGDTDCIWSLGSGSLLKVLPEVTIRGGAPIDLVLFCSLEVTQDPNSSVEESLAVCAYVHWPICSQDNYGSSQLGPGGAPSVASYGYC